MFRDRRRSTAGRIRVDVLVRDAHCIARATLDLEVGKRSQGRSNNGELYEVN